MLILHRKSSTPSKNEVEESYAIVCKDLQHNVGLLSSAVSVLSYIDNKIIEHEDDFESGSLSASEIRDRAYDISKTISSAYGYCGADCEVISSGLLSSNSAIEEYRDGLLGMKEFYTKVKESVINFFKKVWAKIKELWNKIFGSKEVSKNVESANDAANQLSDELDPAKADEISDQASEDIVENQEAIEAAKDLAIFNLCVLNSGYAEMVEEVGKQLEGCRTSREILLKKYEDAVKKRSKTPNTPDGAYEKAEEEVRECRKALAAIEAKLNYTQESYNANKEAFDKQDVVEKTLSNLYNSGASKNLIMDKLGFEVEVDGIGVVKDAVFIPVCQTPFVIFKSPDGLHLKTTNFKMTYSNKATVKQFFKNCYTRVFGSKSQKDVLKTQIKVDKIMSALKNISSKEGANLPKDEKTLENLLNEISNGSPTKEDRELVNAICKLHTKGAIDVASLTQGAAKGPSRISKLISIFSKKAK